MMDKNTNRRTLETEVLIIGGGVTGTGVMRDLALRGISCLLIDQRDLNAGASGGNHGLLHSGGRYASADAETAAECRREGEILKKIMPGAIDACGGMFVAVKGDDEEFAGQFPVHCAEAGIECNPLSNSQALKVEPMLSKKIFAAYQVPDGSIDPFHITLANVDHARQLGHGDFLAHMQLINFNIRDGVIRSAICRDPRTDGEVEIRAQQFVNAAGAWSRKIAQLAACDDVNLLYSKGTLIISNNRISNAVINRLRPPGDGDILVPGGTVSLLGTTSNSVQDLQNIKPTVDEVERILQQGVTMLPVLESTRFIRAFSGVRPLLMSSAAEQDGRKASRGFTLFDHQQQGLTNFATIAGGKLTTFRLMAEKTGDLIAQRMNINTPCQSANVAYPSQKTTCLTKPGYSARNWFKKHDEGDLILCECEMVPQSDVNEVIQQSPGAEQEMTVKAIGLRSRVGKGTCQGAFCSMRVTSHLYDKEFYHNRDGLRHMKSFLSERFKGIKPVLWGEQMPQIELAETMHCGLMGLDQLDASAQPPGDFSKPEND